MTAQAIKAPRAAGAPDTRRVGINLALLTGGEMVAKLITFLAFSSLARNLGPGYYGNLEFTLAVMVFFTLPSDLGLGSYGAREIAKNPGNARTLLAEITGLRLALSLFSFAALAVFIAFLPKPPHIKLLLSLYGVSLLPTSVMLQWFFQGHDRMHWVAVASITRQSVFALLVFAVFRPGMNIAWIGAFECASVAATAAVCIFLARGLPAVRFTGRRLGFHLRQASPIGFTELAWAFMWYFVTVLLGLRFERETLSYFGASHRVLMALHTFVWLYFFNLLPSISRCSTLPGKHLRGLMKPSLFLAAWSSLFVAFVSTALGREILAILYGSRFGDAGASFSVLVWMLPIAMMSGHYRYILVGYNLQGRLLRCTLISGAAAVVLGIVLVRAFGATGGAWTLIAGNALNLALVYREVQKRVMPLPFWNELSRPAIALLLAGGIFVVARQSWSPWIAAAAGSAVYLTMLALSAGREAVTFARRRFRPAQIPAVEEMAG